MAYGCKLLLSNNNFTPLLKECIIDAEKALSLPYPMRLKHKLLIRIARGCLQLHDRDRCQTSLDLAKEILVRESLTNGDSVHGAQQEILALQAELADTQKTILSKSENTLFISEESASKTSLPPLLCGPSSHLPFASAALELRYNFYFIKK